MKEFNQMINRMFLLHWKARLKYSKPNETFYVPGHERKNKNDYPDDEMMSEPVESFCDHCKTDLWSTKSKEEIRQVGGKQIKFLCFFLYV